MRDAVTGYVFEQGLLGDSVVVPVVQRSGAGEKIKIAVPVLAIQVTATGALENDWPASAVTSYLRFYILKDKHK
jgi:hypothetical protein